MCKGPFLSAEKETSVSSGFERRRFSIEVGLLLTAAVYGSVLVNNPDVGEPASEYCQHVGEDETLSCRRPDLVAYKVTSALCMAIMGLMGVANWHFGNYHDEMKSADDRLFGFLPPAEYQNAAAFVYQVWDFCVSLSIPEHLDPLFLVHHILAAFTAWFSLEYQLVSYYAVYFGGCSEFSSIFLVFADLDMFFPPAPGSTYDVFIIVCKVLFTLTFSYYRVAGWWRVSWTLWSDVLYALSSGLAEKRRPGKSSFLYVFLTLNVILGALQLYWWCLIVLKIHEMSNS